MMPERIAKTDPFTQITEYVGSGPDEVRRRRVGAGRERRVREVRRLQATRRADFLAGRRQAHAGRPGRVDHHAGPGDRAAARCRTARSTGGRTRSPTSCRCCRRTATSNVDIADPLGNVGAFRMNHLYPPFDNVEDPPRGPDGDEPGGLHAGDRRRRRRAVEAAAGLLHAGHGRSTPRQGGDILKRRTSMPPRSCWPKPATRASPVVCVVAQDQPITKAQGDITADLLKQMGMNVDFVATDWGTTGPAARRRSRPPRAAGTCSTPGMRAPTAINPAGYTAIRANGDKAWFGWPNVPAGRGRHRRVVRRQGPRRPRRRRIAKVNAAACDGVVYAPTGFFLGYQAWRKNVTRHREGADAVLLGRVEGADGCWSATTRSQLIGSRLQAGSVPPLHSDAARYSLGRHEIRTDDPLMTIVILRRILSTIPVMAIVALFVFSLLYIAPGDPAAIIAGDQATPDDVERIRAEPRPRPALPGALRRMGRGRSCTGISAPRSSPTCRSPR